MSALPDISTQSHGEWFLQGVAEFNQRRFYDCHETLELLWNHTGDPQERLYIQSVIQVSVALHHLQNGNLTGFKNLLAKGKEKLIPLHESQWLSMQMALPHIDVAKLLEDLHLLQEKPNALPVLLLIP